MTWLLYVVFSLLCLLASQAHYRDHRKHHVPCLLFVSMAMLMEAAEYGWIALFLDEPSVYLKNIFTGLRILMVLGFWLGMRYGELDLDNVRSFRDGLRLVFEGYRGLYDRTLRAPWLTLLESMKRLRRRVK